MEDAPENLRRPSRSPAVLAFGYRPFFLLAGVHAVVTLQAWMAMQVGRLASPGPWPGAVWHGHEMLFGYGAAVLAGFLLTATPNWVGTPPVRRAPLAALVILWLVGRAALALAGYLPPAAVVALDGLFLAGLIAAILPVLLARKQWRNVAFVLLPGLLILANLGVHGAVWGVVGLLPRDVFIFTIDIYVLLIVVMGGRIIPSFTRNTLRRLGQEPNVRSRAALERLAMASAAGMTIADAVVPGHLAGGALALSAGLASALRLAGWQSLRTRGDALLWILHLGYAALAAGLLLKGLAAIVPAVSVDVAIHALTVGAIGVMTLAMMTRVALGHTGRALRAHGVTVAAYGLMVAALVLRVATPFLPDGFYNGGIHVSGGLWSLAFVLFLAIYAPILVTRRPDGKPG